MTEGYLFREIKRLAVVKVNTAVHVKEFWELRQAPDEPGARETVDYGTFGPCAKAGCFFREGKDGSRPIRHQPGCYSSAGRKQTANRYRRKKTKVTNSEFVVHTAAKLEEQDGAKITEEVDQHKVPTPEQHMATVRMVPRYPSLHWLLSAKRELVGDSAKSKMLVDSSEDISPVKDTATVREVPGLEHTTTGEQVPKYPSLHWLVSAKRSLVMDSPRDDRRHGEVECDISSSAHGLVKTESELVVDIANDFRREGEEEYGIFSSAHDLVKTESEMVVDIANDFGREGKGECSISSLTHSLARRESKLVVDSAKSIKREGEGECGISSLARSLARRESKLAVDSPRDNRRAWELLAMEEESILIIGLEHFFLKMLKNI